MTPRLLAATRGVIVLVLTIGTLAGAVAQTTGSREPTLRERLTAGLLARRPSEIAFLDAVVETVERGELSERLVNRVFLWARSRPGRGSATDRPIVRFQPALTRLAARYGVSIRRDASSGG